MNLSKDQELAIKEILSGKNIFLTGKAGTGKSTVVRHAIKLLRKNKKKNIAVLGTTGIASMNIGGQTMHSFFSLPIVDFCTFEKCFYIKKEKRRMLNSTDVIIIDEASMLRADLLDGIEYTLLKNRCNSLSTKQIIFVGDLKQLPPVVKSYELPLFENEYKGFEFFHAKIIDNIGLKEIELSTIHRQSNEEFIDNLNILRDGGKSDYFKRFVSSETKGTILTPHTSTAISYNKIKLAELKTEQFEYFCEIENEDGYQIDIDDFRIDRKLILKSGSRIMYLVNDGFLVNGSTGTLLIENNGTSLWFICDDGHKHKINTYVFEKKIYYLDNGDLKLRVVGVVKQYPIKLAYAITIHKSQGLTFDEVTIDLSKKAFVKGQIYTAISRVRTPEGLNIII